MSQELREAILTASYAELRDAAIGILAVAKYNSQKVPMLADAMVDWALQERHDAKKNQGGTRKEEAEPSWEIGPPPEGCNPVR